MFARKLQVLAVVATALLAGCRFSGSYEGPGGAVGVEGQIDPRSGKPPDKRAVYLGEGTITLENGATYRGKFFDTDGDTRPDKFQPDAGQRHGFGPGRTNGSDWYEIGPAS